MHFLSKDFLRQSDGTDGENSQTYHLILSNCVYCVFQLCLLLSRNSDPHPQTSIIMAGQKQILSYYNQKHLRL